MKMKRILAVLMTAGLMVSALAGCTPQGGQTDAPAATPEGGDTAAETQAAGETSAEAALSGEDVTLRFSWWGGDERHEATLAVIEAFEKEYPNITIEAEYSSYDGYAEKKTTEFASGTAPDIFQIETGLGPEYHAQGVLYNLSETSMDFSEFDAEFLVQNGQFGSGSQYAIPTGQAGTALLVNKTLADEIGIDFSQPYDWDQLLEWGQMVQEYNPEYYLLSLNSTYGMPFFVRAWARQVNGEAILNDADMILNMTEEQFAECFAFIQSLYDNNVCVPASYKAPFGENEQEDPNWIAGKYVASTCYTSTVEVMSAVNDEIEYISGNLPIMESAVSDGWFNDCPQYIGIYADSKYPAEAALFLDYFFNSEEAARTLGTVRAVPPTKKAQEICEEEGTLSPLMKQSAEVSMQYNGRSDGGLTTGSEVNAILKDAYENVSYGTKTPEAAASEVVTLLNDFLEANK